MKKQTNYLLIGLMSIMLLSACCQKSYTKQADGIEVKTSAGILKLRPYSFGALRVQWLAEGENTPENVNYAVTSDFPVPEFQVKESEQEIHLIMEQFTAVVNKTTGQLKLLNSKKQVIISELERKSVEVKTDSVIPSGRFRISEGEAIYGLGQFRDNALNLRGKERELIQFNTQAAVPVIYSTAGWGMLWNNPSRTVFRDTPESMSFTSDYGDRVDYYLFIGDSFDELIGAYRTLTGEAPMIPSWALGFHQSRNRYATETDLMDVARRMQEEKIPMSSIFIDYFYWGEYGVGSHRMDEKLFPDPQEMLKTLHDEYNTKAVITIWPAFKSGIEHHKELNELGMLLEGSKALGGTNYDVFNPQARELYWKQILPLVQMGFDGWFLDGPEPDQIPSFLETMTYAGPAVRVRNLYPLLHSASFYSNLIKTYPDKRPYLLTRCAWASQQKAGTAVWSGDIPTTFEELRTQITAGLNFVATGIPYWTTDIGGYEGGNPSDPEYREVFTRWFEYGTFCPVFRSHGRRVPRDIKAPNELWAYGKEVQQICTDYIRLRYALMPYIYTLSGDITHKNYTPMRLLAFDFPEDKTVLDCKDQFMYGPSLLVCPVLDAGITSRDVYLPEGTEWIDFWTNQRYSGKQTIRAEAPKDRIPIYIKSGSLLPFYDSTDKEYAPEEPIVLRIYGGNDGSFSLYEDDGVSYNYQQGKYRYIPIHWNDQERVLTLGNQQGSYQLKPEGKEIRIIIVENEKISPVLRTVHYTGVQQEIKLN
jgi:Alpha-glucosidases, family 31 of glycosyl hydrolases